MFHGIGFGELLVILVIVIIVFGVGKLPEVGRGLGKGIREFREATKTEEEKIRDREDKARITAEASKTEDPNKTTDKPA
jgi:sec-independent protein translocase protein TatA